MAIERFDQLEVWQVAHKLVLDVYRVSVRFPNEEKYGLTAQMRRAAISIPANIAEGFKRRGRQDKSHFYNIAEASLEELRYFFVLCRDLNYSIDFEGFTRNTDQIARMLCGLIRSLRE